MDFEATAIKKQLSQKITLEIDVVGDEIDFTQCEKIADSFTDFIKQVWWLANPRQEFAVSSKVKVQLPKQKTHGQVQLPCASANGQAIR